MNVLTWQKAASCHANGTCVEVAAARWRCSTRSSGGNCAEVRCMGDEVAIRDSKHPAVELRITRTGWARLLNDLRGSG